MTYSAPPPGSGYPDYSGSSGGPGGGPGSPGAAAPKLRGRRAVLIGAILAGVGLVVLVLGIVLVGAKSLNAVSDFQRVKVTAGTGTVKFTKTGGYVAYYESDTVTNNSKQVPLIPIRLTDPSGTATVLSTKYGDRSDGKIKLLHYDYNGHKGLAMWQFHISQTGTYKVELGSNTEAAPDATVAFGESIAAGAVTGGLGILFGLLLLIAGIITLIVGLVRRRHHKTELRATPSGVGPTGWPQQQQQGWSSQPQQGWAQPAQPHDPQQGWQQPAQQPDPQQGWQQPAHQPDPQQGWQQPTQQPDPQQGWQQPTPPPQQQPGWPPSGDQQPPQPWPPSGNNPG